MKMSDVITIPISVIYAQDADKNYILTSGDKDFNDFFLLKDCDAVVFDILARKKEMPLRELKQDLMEEFDLSGISVDDYLPLFIGVLKEKGFIKTM
jgi:hypothetical protein